MSGVLDRAGPDVLQRPTAASDLGILLRSDNETALSFTLDRGAAVRLLAKVASEIQGMQVEMLSGVNVATLPSTRRQAFKFLMSLSVSAIEKGCYFFFIFTFR